MNGGGFRASSRMGLIRLIALGAAFNPRKTDAALMISVTNRQAIRGAFIGLTIKAFHHAAASVHGISDMLLSPGQVRAKKRYSKQNRDFEDHCQTQEVRDPVPAAANPEPGVESFTP